MHLDHGIGKFIEITEFNFGEAEKRLQSMVRINNNLKSADCSTIYQTLAELYDRWGKSRGDKQYYESAIEALDQASGAVSSNDKRAQAQLLFIRGVINCHRKQYDTAGKDFDKCVAIIKNCIRHDSNYFHPAYFAAVRNQERLHESLTLAVGLNPEILKILSGVLALLATVQMVVVWFLYLKGWPGLSAKMFVTLVPLFFGMILISLLLPRLNKFKIGGITAETDSRLEHSEGFTGIQIEIGENPAPSNLTPEPLVDSGQRGSLKGESTMKQNG